jgi:sigma-B regulation protein RsbU (phosphoserine phosphatase)
MSMGAEMVDTKSDSYIRRIEKENERLKTSLEELTILHDIASAISSAWSLERIMELIIRKSIKHCKAEQGAVMLFDPTDEQKPFHTMIRRADTSRNVMPYSLDTQLTGWMLKYKQPLVIGDLRSDARFRVDPEKAQPVQSVLSVPLLFKGRMIGSLNVFNKQTPEGFTEADKRLLTIIGTESAQVIESARLYEKEQAWLLMQKEMKLAYKIQTGLLPQVAPDMSGYDIWGKSIPAKEVGGDYYDFVQMGEHRLGICLGDVSGKGMPAALLMANLQATLRSQIFQKSGTSVCLERANGHLLRSMDSGRFVTLFHAVLDGRTHDLRYSNAGHNYPFLLKGGREPGRLDVGGVALGCMENPRYAETSVTLNPGDIVLLYSDGITEAANKELELFGENRLTQVVADNHDDSAEQIIDKIVEAVREHSGQSTQSDDMTAVIVKRTA